MPVRDLMTKDPIACTPHESLVDVARRMVEHHIGLLPVVESDSTRRAIGCITDRDIVARVVAAGRNPAHVRVGQAMSTDLVSCGVDDDIDHVKALMQHHQVRRVLVLDEERRLIGMVGIADLARAMNELEVGETVRDISAPTEEART
jgi:CBS domain-containing protein